MTKSVNILLLYTTLITWEGQKLQREAVMFSHQNTQKQTENTDMASL
jgi:hypothetical protein